MMDSPSVSERACPQCGRPIRRGLKAKWCSDSCKVRASQERRRQASETLAHTEIAPPTAESQEDRKLTVVVPFWVKVLTGAHLPFGPDYEQARQDAVRSLRHLALMLECHEVETAPNYIPDAAKAGGRS